ncbi:MAG: thiamine phosphate synthase [Verrucomicrobia bacterium]|nr:thiamine phosphate synthase [Verrucomicrobiota bacterium]
MRPVADCRLYGFLDTAYLGLRDPLDVARELISGGVDIIQLRAKTWCWDDIVALARRILPLTRAAGVPLIINDHVELARRASADGVHLGQEDIALMPVSAVRARLGPGRLVGLSTHSLAQAKAAETQRSDYIGIGPIFATGTKPGRAPIGLVTLRAVANAVRLPAFAIGGITPANLPSVIQHGATRIAVVSAILCAPDIAAVARAFKQALNPQPSTLNHSPFTINHLPS